jgi:predicted RNA-binding protein YlqC (UPF0109 family)
LTQIAIPQIATRLNIASWEQLCSLAGRLELDIQKEKMGKLIGTQGKTIQAVQLRAQNITLRTPSKEEVIVQKLSSSSLSSHIPDLLQRLFAPPPPPR